MTKGRVAGWVSLALVAWLLTGQLCAGAFDVKTFGAKGDGKNRGPRRHQ